MGGEGRGANNSLLIFRFFAIFFVEHFDIVCSVFAFVFSLLPLFVVCLHLLVSATLYLYPLHSFSIFSLLSSSIVILTSSIIFLFHHTQASLLTPGECWPLVGTSGHIVIELAAPLSAVTAVVGAATLWVKVSSQNIPFFRH